MVTQGDSTSIPGAFVMFLVQMVVGLICGYLIGRLAVWLINRMKFSNKALYPVLMLAFAFFSFAFTSLLHGNGYLAVYLSGLVVGNQRLDNKNEMVNFFDGFQSLWQIVMFLTLGLLVNPKELLDPSLLTLGVFVALFMIFVARPAAVFLCLAPFRKFTTKARLYISWVGLRGAVPIIFATYPMLAGAPEDQARLLFNIVFLVTIISLVVQGTTVSGMANLLGLAYEERESSFKVNIHDSISSVLSEVEVNKSLLSRGSTLKDITLPDNTLVMMVCRDGDYFVPQGKTQLLLGDKLLLISDRQEELQSTYKDFGVDDIRNS
jgi:cell volume regulation protein A